jgi:hypothetical protein
MSTLWCTTVFPKQSKRKLVYHRFDGDNKITSLPQVLQDLPIDRHYGSSQAKGNEVVSPHYQQYVNLVLPKN